MIDSAEMAALLQAMRSPATCTADVIARYYTLCIPIYREFLGDHWHTGWYRNEWPIGPQDQLVMELVIARSANLGRNDHVLDVGCGIGGAACHLASATGARIRGLTPVAAQIALARELARANRLEDRVAFDQGSADHLPYADETFDVVLFFESACHFPDREAFFREVMRVLRPGGRLAGEDWVAASGLTPEGYARYVEPICATWAIPSLGTCASYAAQMREAGLMVCECADMRNEMALPRGFLSDAKSRDEMRADMDRAVDPIRRIIMEGLVHLGEAVEAQAFTIGRFLAVKEA